MPLNPDQQEVVLTHQGAIALISGPGSGKTTTLLARHESIISNGARLDEVLNITFTKEAAETMKKRAGGKGHFRTFHSYGYHVISQELGRPPMEPELRNRLLFKLLRTYGCEYKELTSYISRMRHRNITPTQALDEDSRNPYARAYRDYEAQRISAGWIDFDSMICDAVALLEKPEVRARHQWKFVMADECQDTDDLQFRMLQLVTEKHGNIMCVGDPGQSIYMFRGARPENLLDFMRWFPQGRYMYLGKNYRSTHSITRFVRENYPIETPLRDKLLPVRPENGTAVEYRMFGTEYDEAESAVVCANKDALNSAILTRTNRGLALAENFCVENNIKYHLLGSSGFWHQSEIRRTIEKLKTLPDLPTEAAVNIILPEIESKYRVEDATPEDNDALENLGTLRQISRRYPLCKEFTAFANRAMHAKKTRGIILSTVHQAKGGEWTNVFVIGVRADMMPHIKGDYEEEKRIWFVAISRAKDNLRISWAGTPSSYLRSYLTPEVLDKLRENQGNVERLQRQFNLIS